MGGGGVLETCGTVPTDAHQGLSHGVGLCYKGLLLH